jgi:hypothetical protein
MEPDDDDHELTLTPAKAKALANELRNARRTMDTFEFNPMYAAQDNETNETKDTNETNRAEDDVEGKQVKSKCLAFSRCWAFACWASVKHVGTRTPRE